MPPISVYHLHKAQLLLLLLPHVTLLAELLQGNIYSKKEICD
jgi:hypothetical protein